MDKTTRSAPELWREAAEAHLQADMTLELGEELLHRAKEVRQQIEDRVQAATHTSDEAEG